MSYFLVNAVDMCGGDLCKYNYDNKQEGIKIAKKKIEENSGIVVTLY